MRLPFAPIVSLIAIVAFVVGGCGSDSSSSKSASSEPTATVTATVTVTATPTDSVASAKPGPQDCAPRDDIKIRIGRGQIDCASAYLVAARMDGGGEKRQNIDGYVCEYGNAMTRPTIFICTDRELGASFAVNER